MAKPVAVFTMSGTPDQPGCFDLYRDKKLVIHATRTPLMCAAEHLLRIGKPITVKVVIKDYQTREVRMFGIVHRILAHLQLIPGCPRPRAA